MVSVIHLRQLEAAKRLGELRYWSDEGEEKAREEEAHYTDGDGTCSSRCMRRTPARLMSFLQRLNSVPGEPNSRTRISLANP